MAEERRNNDGHPAADAAPPFCRSTLHLLVRPASPSSPDPGRHAILSLSSGGGAAVPAGTVLSRSVPLAHVLRSDYKEERCARCLLSKPPRGETPTLSRCSRCRAARYCGRACQRADFPYHKAECRRGAAVAPEVVREEAELLARTRAALTVAEGEGVGEDDASTVTGECVLCSESGEDDDAMPAVRCGRRHFDSMARASSSHRVPPDHAAADRLAIDAASRLCRDRRWDAADIGRYLDIFRANNFGILDGTLNVIGSGVYPHAAVLNHSCDPNCVLRYGFGGDAALGPVLEIVALRTIRDGEELTHSYADLVHPTDVRRARLGAAHGFTCSCRRCAGRCSVELPDDFVDRPDMAMGWILEHHNPHPKRSGEGTSDAVSVVQLEIDDAMDRCGGGGTSPTSARADAIEASNALQEEAQRHMNAEDAESELRCAEGAVARLASDPSVPPFSLELYSARGALLSSLLVLGQTDEAADVCRHVVAFLCVALGHVPNHPLLGLQLFTLGDLYAAVGEDVRAKAAYVWARDVLRVCQGRDSELVKRLDHVLDS